MQQKRVKIPTLSEYIKRRNGVPLGASGSLQNMLVRSLEAGSFARFWQYWNPIWGYVMGRYVYAPLNRFLPTAIALMLTFTISGAIHELATMLVRRSPAFFFTPWFYLMSVVVVFGRLLKLDYSNKAFQVRVAINVMFILACLMITLGVRQLL